ncbi:cytokine-like protein 1 [Tachyglossus aculeatus]|uniref:cytokine-like protein 1 n=1 Tax=Tachyglossus aculeatus TaxID=9261 RepID=UPI0018F430E8|nr:cytokine-like protein 1 [Tachyglossus aculeatus]
MQIPRLCLGLASMCLFVSAAPLTCYSRILNLSQEIMDSFQSLQTSEPVEPCVQMLPKLYLDIHNYCVLTKLRNFIAAPKCRKVPHVGALKDKVRSLYIIMNSFCRRDLVFLTDDCDALENAPQSPTAPMEIQS